MELDLNKIHYFSSQYRTKHSVSFADDQVTIADSKGNLQREVFTLDSTAKVLEGKFQQKNLGR